MTSRARRPDAVSLVELALLVTLAALLGACATTRGDSAACDAFDYTACVRASQAAGEYPVDPDRIRALFLEATERCNQGDDEACLGWADFYEWVAPPADAPGPLAEALERRCEAGDEARCAQFGRLIVSDVPGVPVERERALPYLRRGCEMQSVAGAWACAILAWNLSELGREDEASEVLEAQRAACSSGPSNRARCLATFAMLRWRGAPRSECLQYAEPACLEHNTNACLMWRTNSGDPPPEAAMTELLTGCAEGDSDHCRAIAVVRQSEADDDAVLAESLRDLYRLCRAGTTAACYDAPYIVDGPPTRDSSKLSFLYLTELCFTFQRTPTCETYAEAALASLSEPRHAVPTALALCERGMYGVCGALGDAMLRDPALASHAPASAERYLSMACDHGVGRACGSLSDVHDGIFGHPVDLERSLYFLWQGCELGHRDSCDEREHLALTAGGMNPSVARRVVTLHRACDEGDPASCQTAGVLLVDHGGLPEAERAQPLLARACRSGLGLACLRLGDLYGAGWLDSDEEHNMTRYYRLGCEAGNVDACNFLGVLAEDGLGDESLSSEESERSYRIACEGGSRIGCSNLGWLLWSQTGEPTPSAEVEALADRACPEDESYACSLLAYILEVGTPSHPPDPERSLALYERSCGAGNHRGCVFAGEIYEGRDQAELAFDFYHRGCGAGSGVGCYYQALCYRYGYGVAKSHAWASASLQQACTIGSAAGCELLGWAHFDGMGVAFDWDLAWRFWQRACDLGSESACIVLEEWDQLTRPVSPAKPGL